MESGCEKEYGAAENDCEMASGAAAEEESGCEKAYGAASCRDHGQTLGRLSEASFGPRRRLKTLQTRTNQFRLRNGDENQDRHTHIARFTRGISAATASSMRKRLRGVPAACARLYRRLVHM